MSNRRTKRRGRRNKGSNDRSFSEFQVNRRKPPTVKLGDMFPESLLKLYNKSKRES